MSQTVQHESIASNAAAPQQDTPIAGLSPDDDVGVTVEGETSKPGAKGPGPAQTPR